MSGSSTRSSRGFGGGPSRSDMPTMPCWSSSGKMMRGGCLRCWRSGWRSTAFACTRTRRGWWSFAVRRSRSGVARSASAASRCWGSRITGGAPGRGDGWSSERRPRTDSARALRGIGQWCRTHRHWKLRDQQAVLSRKLRGHYAYYGITTNATALSRFRSGVIRLWRKWLGRRNRERRMSWERFKCFSKPIPSLRRAWCTVCTVEQRGHSPRSRMPELGTYGSAGAAGG